MSASRIGEQFDQRAGRYDNPVTAFIGERELRRIRPLVPAGSEVLDFGCGTGRTTLDHLRRNCRVTAFDISKEMLAIAAAKARRAGWQATFTADAEELRVRTWPFVTCIGVLDYYPDPAILLLKLKAHLSPGGRLVVTYPNGASPLAWLYAIGSRFTTRAYPRTPGAARGDAAAAGLRVDSLEYAFPHVRWLGHTLVLALADPLPAVVPGGRLSNA